MTVSLLADDYGDTGQDRKPQQNPSRASGSERFHIEEDKPGSR